MKNYLNNLFKGDFGVLQKRLVNSLDDTKKEFIITANPEIMMCDKIGISSMLLNEENIIVADGIAVLKKSIKYKIRDVYKITGIDIAYFLLQLANERGYKILLIGASKEVNEKLVKVINTEYCNVEIIGSCDGYGNCYKNMKKYLKKEPDIILVATGVPAQELLINEFYDRVSKGIFIGVGGSFDVISGSKKRAHKFFLKTNTEWLYRICKEPVRFKRFYCNNIKFLFRR